MAGFEKWRFEVDLFHQRLGLREALKAVVEVLDCEHMQSAMRVLYAHRPDWTGPRVNMNKIRKLLAECEALDTKIAEWIAAEEAKETEAQPERTP